MHDTWSESEVDRVRRSHRRRKPGGKPATILLILLVLIFLAWAALSLAEVEVTGLSIAGYSIDRFTVAAVALTQYAVLAGVLLFLLTLVFRRWLSMLIVLLTTAALVFFVAPRAIPDMTAAQGAPLRVLSINAYLGQADASHIVELVRRNRVDVLSVQELTPELATELNDAGLNKELPNQLFKTQALGGGTGIAARYPMQELRLVPNSSLAQPSARVVMPDGPAVEVVAVHPMYPMGDDTAGMWADELRALPDPPGRGVRRMLVGDFNATLDHTLMKRLTGRGYTDAAEVTGAGLYPTWPAGKVLAPPVTIDHVLTSKGIMAQSYQTIDVAGSDHHAILATLVISG